MFITPGPNNAMITISGLKFGFKKTLPHLTGIALGHALQISLVCAGLGFILINNPEIQIFLKWACFFYLLFLSYKMLGSFKDYNKESGKPLRAYEAALFQWINPKAWTIAITVAGGFMPLDENLIIAVLFIGIMSSLISFPCVGLWALFGSMIKRVVSNIFIKKIIEYIFAILLVLTAIYLVLN